MAQTQPNTRNPREVDPGCQKILVAHPLDPRLLYPQIHHRGPPTRPRGVSLRRLRRLSRLWRRLEASSAQKTTLSAHRQRLARDQSCALCRTQGPLGPLGLRPATDRGPVDRARLGRLASRRLIQGKRAMVTKLAENIHVLDHEELARNSRSLEPVVLRLERIDPPLRQSALRSKASDPRLPTHRD